MPIFECKSLESKSMLHNGVWCRFFTTLTRALQHRSCVTSLNFFVKKAMWLAARPFGITRLLIAVAGPFGEVYV